MLKCTAARGTSDQSLIKKIVSTLRTMMKQLKGKKYLVVSLEEGSDAPGESVC